MYSIYRNNCSYIFNKIKNLMSFSMKGEIIHNLIFPVDFNVTSVKKQTRKKKKEKTSSDLNREVNDDELVKQIKKKESTLLAPSLKQSIEQFSHETTG